VARGHIRGATEEAISMESLDFFDVQIRGGMGLRLRSTYCICALASCISASEERIDFPFFGI
jgi:hypothetical protein